MCETFDQDCIASISELSQVEPNFFSIFTMVIVAYVQDIVYEIFHCNQFIIPSKATARDTSTKHHSAGTLVRCSCLTINDFAVQAEMDAVETSIDVGNILWILYDCLQLEEKNSLGCCVQGQGETRVR